MKSSIEFLCRFLQSLLDCRCCLLPLLVCALALATSYITGLFICRYEMRHVGFDLLVVTSGIVVHIYLHEAVKRLRGLRRRR